MRAIIWGALILLAACGGYRHPPEEDVEDAVESCEDMGFTRGRSDYQSCVQLLARKGEEERQRKLLRELAR